MATGSSPAEWFVIAAGREQGPVTTEVVRKYIAAGKITPKTLVRRQDMPAAVAAGKVPSFFPAGNKGRFPTPILEISLDPASLTEPAKPSEPPAAPPPPPAPEPEPPASAPAVSATPIPSTRRLKRQASSRSRLTPEIPSVVAPPARRALAWTIDALVVGLPAGALLVFGLCLRSWPLIVVAALIPMIYRVVCEGGIGTTLGKRWCGLRVRRDGGGRCGFLRAFLRNPAYLLLVIALAVWFLYLQQAWPPEASAKVGLAETWQLNGRAWDNLIATRGWFHLGFILFLVTIVVQTASGLRILIAADRRAFHDVFANTVCVHLVPPPAMEEAAAGETAVDDAAVNPGLATTRRLPPPRQGLASTRRMPMVETAAPVKDVTDPLAGVLPCLAPATWPKATTAPCRPLAAGGNPAIPWVAFARPAEDAPAWIDRTEVGDLDPHDLEARALMTLRTRRQRPEWIRSAVRVGATTVDTFMRTGDDFTASDLIDHDFLAQTQALLGSTAIVIAVPERTTMLACLEPHAAALATLVGEQVLRVRTRKGEVLSDALFSVRNGQVAGVVRLRAK